MWTFNSFTLIGLVLFLLMLLCFFVQMYTFCREKKGVATDVINKPYSALVWGAVWGPLFWGGRNVTREGTLFPSACTLGPQTCIVRRENEKLHINYWQPCCHCLNYMQRWPSLHKVTPPLTKKGLFSNVSQPFVLKGDAMNIHQHS